jgi:hypothetical protein
VKISVLVVRDDELDVGDDEVASSEVADDGTLQVQASETRRDATRVNAITCKLGSA